jgi:hypothetical protein
MSDFNDTSQPQPGSASGPQAVGFCQNCGKPLTSETIRKVGPAVYCEPCLAARLGTNAPGASVPPAYGPVKVGVTWRTGGWTTENLNQSGPNPGLAALLGLIPGVGAMYNEQYAKGIVHLGVFAVLVSLADNVNGIFGLFCFGWICYMAIEAHHTARARRDGTPLPNPFGLNDIGERLGFGRAWPSGPSTAEVATDAAVAAAAAASQATAGYSTPPAAQPYQAPPQPAAPSWGAPTDAYSQQPNPQVPYRQADYARPFVDAAYAKAYADMGYGTPPADAPFAAGSVVPPSGNPQPFTPVAPYAPVPPFDPSLAPSPSRFPAGAVVLIGLGTIFLLTTTGLFNGFPGEALVGCVLFGLGAWFFLRRMMDTGATLVTDGTAGYTLRVVTALRFSVWFAALGALFLLDAFHLLPWRHSWPLLIILAGVMAILQRAAYQALAAAPPVISAPAPDSSKGAN